MPSGLTVSTFPPSPGPGRDPGFLLPPAEWSAPTLAPEVCSRPASAQWLPLASEAPSHPFGLHPLLPSAPRWLPRGLCASCPPPRQRPADSLRCSLQTSLSPSRVPTASVSVTQLSPWTWCVPLTVCLHVSPHGGTGSGRVPDPGQRPPRSRTDPCEDQHKRWPRVLRPLQPSSFFSSISNFYKCRSDHTHAPGQAL